MKQIDVCLNRFFNGEKPLKVKWQARRHNEFNNILILYHYHHLVLIYDLEKNVIVREWWELPADKRGLEAAKDYLQKMNQ
jgi:hypothetical protein